MDGCVSASVSVLDTLTGTHEHWNERNKRSGVSSDLLPFSSTAVVTLFCYLRENLSFSPLDFWVWVEVYTAVTVKLRPTTALPKWIYCF